MMRRALLPTLLATLALGTLTACRQSPARAEASPQPKGDPVRGEYLTAIFACQECHTPREPNGMHLDRARLFAGGIPFEGPWGLVHSANVSIPARTFPDRVLEDAIRGRLAWKFQMPTDLYRGMAADDMRDIVAFIKTLRPVLQPLPENHFEPSVHASRTACRRPRAGTRAGAGQPRTRQVPGACSDLPGLPLPASFRR